MILSLIIPFYNSEKYIYNTLHSITDQENLNDCEIILVNDGSTDKSVQVIGSIVERNNVQIIKQKNLGLSCARNAGLKVATGDFIWFIDSDDTIEKGSIKNIIGYIKRFQADIMAFDMNCIYESNDNTEKSPIFYKSQYKKLYWLASNKYMLINKIRETPAQRFIFKRSFLEKNNLNFFPGIYHEDNEFMVRALFYAKTILPIPYAPYKYLIRNSGSITSTKSLKHIKDKFIIIQSLQDFSKKHAKNKAEKHFLDFYIFVLLHYLLKEQLYSEYYKITPLDKSFLKRIIINGAKASCHFLLWRSFLKSIIDLLKV